ncbi:hypothetical protein V496_03394, partial [Pseudogymnoascus sp. VKM F-4515 (FW-2607)]
TVEWKKGQTSHYPLTPGYFALSPLAFGLSYDIFASDVVVEVVGGVPVATITTGNWASQATITAAYTAPASLRKRAPATAPAICFPPCNNALGVAQEIGKTPALCAAGSPFLNFVSACRLCVASNGDATQQSLQGYVVPEWQQWIDFCDAHGSESVVVPGPGQGQEGGGGGVTTLEPGVPTSGPGIPVEPSTTGWRNETVTTRSSRVPTSTAEEPGTTLSSETEGGSGPTEVPSGTTQSSGVAGPTGGGGGSTPGPSITPQPNEALRVGGGAGGVGGVVGLMMFVFAFVMFG